MTPVPCPHLWRLGIRGERCQLLHLSGSPASSSPPCEACRAQWIDGRPPDARSMPQVLFDLLPPGSATEAEVPPKQTLADAASSAAGALADYALHGPVSAEIKAARLSHCAVCPHRATHLGVDVCSLCWCVLALKTSVAGQSCPMSPARWDAAPPADPGNEPVTKATNKPTQRKRHCGGC